GLGLAISRQLVTAMGGTIGADPNPTGGSTFWVRLPLPLAHQTTPAHQAPPATHEPVTSASRGHLLVVEDSEINQLVAVGILEHLGYTADVADHGHDALTRLEDTTYDAVLMDCQMPVMDGYEATGRIRAHPRHQHLPVIAMTAAAVDGDRERCLAAGMDDYISKPVDPDDLQTTLDRWLTTPTSTPTRH
ncbi:response regulator, partial [Nocardioides ferulae]|uniref:response regulator n=1 Tax=Nocardioides ferulae TaxID=2340821 RepID=UPI0013DDC95B